MRIEVECQASFGSLCEIGEAGIESERMFREVYSERKHLKDVDGLIGGQVPNP